MANGRPELGPLLQQDARYATADPGVTGRQLESDEAALFVQRGLLDAPCGAALVLWNSPTESHDGGYTVGRVFLETSSFPLRSTI